MDEEQLRARIRERIQNGLIPTGSSVRTYGGKSTNSTCTCCSNTIGPREVEYEVYFEGSPTAFRAHLSCYRLWWKEREFAQAAGPLARARAVAWNGPPLSDVL